VNLSPGKRLALRLAAEHRLLGKIDEKGAPSAIAVRSATREEREVGRVALMFCIAAGWIRQGRRLRFSSRHELDLTPKGEVIYREARHGN
jgi:hypothetical protein